MISNVSDYFKQKARFLPIDIKVNKYDFTLIPLTDELIELAKESDSPVELINFAADYGLAYYTGECEKSACVRTLDNAKMTQYVDELWKEDGITNSDPSIREVVGINVIEASGLAELLSEMRDNEQEEKDRLVECVKEKISTGVPLTDEELEVVKMHDLKLHEDMDKVQSDINAHNNIQ